MYCPIYHGLQDSTVGKLACQPDLYTFRTVRVLEFQCEKNKSEMLKQIFKHLR